MSHLGIRLHNGERELDRILMQASIILGHVSLEILKTLKQVAALELARYEHTNTQVFPQLFKLGSFHSKIKAGLGRLLAKSAPSMETY